MVGQIEKIPAINHKNQKLLPAGFYAIRSIISLLYVLSLRLVDQAPELSDTGPQARIIFRKTSPYFSLTKLAIANHGLSRKEEP
jgi:hypothetical protein